MEDSGIARTGEERMDRSPAALAEIVGEFVYIEPDVRLHDLIAHLDCVLANVRHHRGFVPSSEVQARTDGGIERSGLRRIDVVANENRAERNWKQRHVLPPLSEVGDRDQTGVAVGEARFVNDQPGIDLAVGDGGDDFVKAHLRNFRTASQGELQQHEGRRPFAWNRDALAREVRKMLRRPGKLDESR